MVQNDNALLLVIVMLIKYGVKDVNLASFDGSGTNKKGYYDSKYAFVGNAGYKINTNDTTIAGLKALSMKINIIFAMLSLYDILDKRWIIELQGR